MTFLRHRVALFLIPLTFFFFFFFIIIILRKAPRVSWFYNVHGHMTVSKGGSRQLISGTERTVRRNLFFSEMTLFWQQQSRSKKCGFGFT